MTWRDYHEYSKHSVEKLRLTQHYLDWANMPDPFRHYEGVPLLDLPADPPAPEISALEVLVGKIGTTLSRDGPAFLSQLLFYSASISAFKRVPSTGSNLRTPGKSFFRESPPDRISLLFARARGVARRALSLSPLFPHGRAARPWRFRQETGQLR